MKSTRHRCCCSLLLLGLAVACTEQRAAPRSDQRPQRKPRVENRLQREGPREMRHRLVPRLVRGAAADAGVGDLLRLDASLGLKAIPYLRKAGAHRAPTAAELEAILDLGEGLPVIYRRNLGRMLGEASLVAVGGDSAEARLLDLDMSLPGIEAVLLLPEVWDKARDAIGDREVWAALPDRGHCLFFPAGPWRILVEKLADLRRWSEHGDDPLCDRLIYRDGDTLRGGPAFDSLR